MKAVSLFSGGLDSHVASHLMQKKGIELILLNFHSGRYSQGYSKEKIIEEMKALEKYGKISGNVASNEKALESYIQTCDKKFTCVFCKRFMLRCAEKIAKQHGAEFIITGETLGSKASQTAENLEVIKSAAKLPVLRPVLCFNKEEIFEHARKIGTYKFSSSSTCCTAVPKKPSTIARASQINAEEVKLDIPSLVSEACGNAEKVL